MDQALYDVINKMHDICLRRKTMDQAGKNTAFARVNRSKPEADRIAKEEEALAKASKEELIKHWLTKAARVKANNVPLYKKLFQEWEVLARKCQEEHADPAPKDVPPSK